MLITYCISTLLLLQFTQFLTVCIPPGIIKVFLILILIDSDYRELLSEKHFRKYVTSMSLLKLKRRPVESGEPELQFFYVFF